MGTPAILSGGVAQPATQTIAATVKANRFIVPPKISNPLPTLLSLARMASGQTRIRQQNANGALCQPVSGNASMDLRSYFAAVSVTLLSGCAADYFNNYDTMTLASGDANNTNSLLQTVDPFNPHSNNTHIEGVGQRSVAVVQRYRVPTASPRMCFIRPIRPGRTHCVAGRFMPFGMASAGASR
ncbi:hypothetical protein [Mesorhizobium sp. CA17]|uniref:hypothetical protein n=2 Tax=Mesorhizobium TaxID=68287 RepID=UPI001CCFCDD8|nr:hypothetical protein [Mesorhizobium sp. CA17]MBZ9899083.1 hypothetical protein [Mesorhizobium sp. CA17]